jgi:hypothetical protein
VAERNGPRALRRILGLSTPNETPVTDLFVARYDTLGNLVWAESIHGNGAPAGVNAVAADPTGHTYLTGSFATTITFAPNSLNPTTLVSLGGFFGGDLFVAKYDPDGSFLWARQAGGIGETNSGGESGNGVAVDANGNAYVAGVFGGDTIFGFGESNETVLSSNSIVDPEIFVAKYGVASPTIPTATSLTAVPDTATLGTPIAFTADIISTGGTPTGTVEFYDGAALIGSVSLNNGTAQLVISTLGVGMHSVAASYLGDANFDASSSPNVNVTITPPPNGPDLTGAWQSLTEICGARGCAVGGTFTIVNQGSANVPPGPGRTPAFVTRFYLSSTGVLDGTQILLGQRGTPSINAGQQISLKSSFPVGTDPSGKYVIGVIDADLKVTESDETNNIVGGVVP